MKKAILSLVAAFGLAAFAQTQQSNSVSAVVVGDRNADGRTTGNRHRMVVMPFRSLTDKVNVFGQELQVGTTCETIAAALNENLVQTRRFSMLDRAFNAETSAELSRQNLENASADDLGRFKKLLVTDYMVIGTVKMYPSPSTSYNQWTGVTTQNDGPFLEVAYRLIFVPTQNRGATDARHYERLCRCVMRFGPFLEEEDVSAEGVHGTNERISIRAWLQGVRVLLRLMEETCVKDDNLA